MSIKKNFLYSTILTSAKYLFPIITFPYISRVLGVSNIGLVSFVDSIVNYFILFSTMGIGILGVKEIARQQQNKDLLNITFSELFIIHFSSTIIFLLIYFLCFCFVPELSANKDFFYIGAAKLLFNVFLIEWFFKGVEKFKYITTRSIAINLLYVIFIFICVKSKDDCKIYYSLTALLIAINASFNWWYSRRYIKLQWIELNFKKYLMPFFTLGFYYILTSLYTNFNILYLGFVSNTIEVGYYTTATKIQTIVLSIFTAFTFVMMPRMSALAAPKDKEKFAIMAMKSYEILLIICFPLIFGLIILAPELVYLLAGNGYEGAILPLRIVAPLIFLAGMNQIFSMQILIPLNKNNLILIASACGAFISLILNMFITSQFKSIGTSIIVLVSECAVGIFLGYSTIKNTDLKFSLVLMFKLFIFSFPTAFICLINKYLFTNEIYIVSLSFFLSTIYFFIIHIMILKNQMIIDTFNDMIKYVTNSLKT